MAGESKNIDLKVKVDMTSLPERMELVKNIISLANSGGGSLIVGQDEKRKQGISSAEARNLDSARIADLVTSYIKPAQITISHEIEELRNGKSVVTLNVEPALYPIVISKQGFDPVTNKPVFDRGQIWIRHSTKTEPIEYEDIRTWIESAKEQALERLKDKLRLVTDLPEDADVKAVTSSGQALSSPAAFLENETSLRSINKDHLIEPFYLNWLFFHKERLKIKKKELALLVASSLRRSSTLYGWLVEVDEDPDLIKDELFAAVKAQDRDKSDAASNIVDVGAIYLADRDISLLIEKIKSSPYSHFKEAAREWRGRERQLLKLAKRIETAKLVSGEVLKDKKLPELSAIATELAKEILSQKSNALARKLADVNIVIWGKRTRRLKFKSSQKKNGGK